MSKWDYLIEFAFVKNPKDVATVGVHIDTNVIAELFGSKKLSILHRIGLTNGLAVTKLLKKLKILGPLQGNTFEHALGPEGVTYEWKAASKAEAKTHVDKLFNHVKAVLRVNPTIDERLHFPIQTMAWQGDDWERASWKYRRSFEEEW